MASFELLICACLIALSGFMAASEIAVFSLSRFQLRTLKERFPASYRLLKKLLSDPGGLLITILVTNELVNISLSTLITHAVNNNWPDRDWRFQILVGLLITSPVVLLLCEVTPKAIAVHANQIVAPMAANPLTLIYNALKPVRIVLARVVSSVSRLIGNTPTPYDENGTQKLLREKEFLIMIEEGHREGAVHENEMELIRNVFDLDDTRVGDVYTPLNQVHSLPSHTTIRAAMAAMKGKHFSRIPITKNNRKQVVGVLYSKDLLFTKLDGGSDSRTIEHILHEAFVVSVTTRLNVLFRRMKQEKTHLAIVANPIGDTLGVVTMDDVLDALFEEILEVDESVKPPPLPRPPGGRP